MSILKLMGSAAIVPSSENFHCSGAKLHIPGMLGFRLRVHCLTVLRSIPYILPLIIAFTFSAFINTSTLCQKAMFCMKINFDQAYNKNPALCIMADVLFWNAAKQQWTEAGESCLPHLL